MNTKPCTCWEDIDNRLREKGYRLHPDLSAIQMENLNMFVVRQLPLAKADGSKMKKADPANIRITHCPFCGSKLED